MSLYRDEEKAFSALVNLVKYLRSEDGCLWDREQDYLSMASFLLEESEELAQALKCSDLTEAREEWGDLFFNLLSIAQIGEERGDFALEELMKKAKEKMIRRHPHVFGNKELKSVAEILSHWNQIKEHEKSLREENQRDASLEKLSPMKRAQALQAMASEKGFDWQEPLSIIAKVEEEIAELKEAIKSQKEEKIQEEIGDLLFTGINLARFLKMDAEEMLQRATNKFMARFSRVKAEAQKRGIDLQKSTLEELDALWEEFKK